MQVPVLNVLKAMVLLGAMGIAFGQMENVQPLMDLALNAIVITMKHALLDIILWLEMVTVMMRLILSNVTLMEATVAHQMMIFQAVLVVGTTMQYLVLNAPKEMEPHGAMVTVNGKILSVF